MLLRTSCHGNTELTFGPIRSCTAVCAPLLAVIRGVLRRCLTDASLWHVRTGQVVEAASAVELCGGGNRSGVRTFRHSSLSACTSAEHSHCMKSRQMQLRYQHLIGRDWSQTGRLETTQLHNAGSA